MIKFINETPDMHKEFTGILNIEMTISDEASLQEMLEAFESFLKASGYTIDGNLDIIPKEEYYGSDTKGGGGGDFSSVHWDETATLTVSNGDETERAFDDHDGGMLRSGC